MEQLPNNLNLAGLSISEDGPNLTSRTPPPPGFDGSANTERERSTSFNNLAVALGTGLAESMENSTSDTLGQQQQQGLQQPRIPTPSNVDNYTRQSRHLASRLVGGSNNGGSGGIQHMGGGFDYLNPSGTGHLLIPPSNNAFLEKLKAEREKAGASGLQGNQASQRGNDFLSSLSGATNQQQGQQGSDAFTTAMNNPQVQSNRVSNISSNANQHELNSNQEMLTQELLKHQMWQQNNGTNNYKANMQPVGLTVVEPSSRNSPAPRSIAMNQSGLMYPANDSNVGNGRMVGSLSNPQGNNGNGENFVLRNGVVNLSGGRLSAPPPNTEGRASAPPVNSQRATGVMNVGLGGLNNAAAMRALQTSSLQMRVAELHQELGGNGNISGVKVSNNATMNLRTMPGGNVIVLSSPAPPASQVILKGPSRETTPLDRNSPRPQMPITSVLNATLQQQCSRVNPEQKERERVAVEQLAPYLRDPPKNQKYHSNAASNVTRYVS